MSNLSALEISIMAGINKGLPPHAVAHVLSIIDGETEELIDVIQIPYFDLERFKVQFDVSNQTDPQMLDRYAVGPGDIAFINRALGLEIEFDFTNTAYFIEAVKNDT